MNATPIEIDTELAELHGRYTVAMTRFIQSRESARKYKDDRYTEQAAKYRAEADALLDEMSPLNAEYVRRGRWTRAFVVADGHVHSSMECSTCNNGIYPTEFGWVTEFSGQSEAEVVEAAGSRACTVCYLTAPVDAPAGRIFHATEIAAQAAREERAAKKAAADAKKAANAFGPFRTNGTQGTMLETVYAAKGFLTDGSEWGWNHPSFRPEDRDAVATLLAEKLGTTVEAQVDAAAKRAANR